MNFYGLQIEAIGVVVDGIKDQLESLELLAEEAEEDDLAVEFKAARKNLRAWQAQLNGIDAE